MFTVYQVAIETLEHDLVTALTASTKQAEELAITYAKVTALEATQPPPPALSPGQTKKGILLDAASPFSPSSTRPPPPLVILGRENTKVKLKALFRAAFTKTLLQEVTLDMQLVMKLA